MEIKNTVSAIQNPANSVVFRKIMPCGEETLSSGALMYGILLRKSASTKHFKKAQTVFPKLYRRPKG